MVAVRNEATRPFQLLPQLGNTLLLVPRPQGIGGTTLVGCLEELGFPRRTAHHRVDLAVRIVVDHQDEAQVGADHLAQVAALTHRVGVGALVRLHRPTGKRCQPQAGDERPALALQLPAGWLEALPVGVDGGRLVGGNDAPATPVGKRTGCKIVRR